MEVPPGLEHSKEEEEWEQVDEKMSQVLLTDDFETIGSAVTKPKNDTFDWTEAFDLDLHDDESTTYNRSTPRNAFAGIFQQYQRWRNCPISSVTLIETFWLIKLDWSSWGPKCTFTWQDLELFVPQEYR